MNILLINHYAGTPEMGMEYRPYHFAKEWRKMGHRVVIIAASYSHLRRKQPVINKNEITFEVIDDIEYFWLKTSPYSGNGIKRVINIFQFVFKLLFNASWFIKNYKFDAVIASSTYPLDIFPAAKIAKKCKCKLVFEVHDLWPLSPIELGGMSKYNPFIMLLQYAENFAYKKSDAVVSLLPNTKEYMVQHGLKPEKWSYVPNGVEIEKWENKIEIPIDLKNKITSIYSSEKKTVAYAGSVGISNALDYYITAAKLCINEPLNFVLVGNGPELDRLKKRTKDENITNLFFIDTVSKEYIPHLLSFFDFLYIGWQNIPLYKHGVSPNKLMDYMMAGKPIIHGINLDKDIVNELECGYTIEPENPDQICIALQKLLKLSPAEYNKMGNNGKNYVYKNRNFTFLTNTFTKVLTPNRIE